MGFSARHGFSSPDGIKGFQYGEHPPAVDHRTKPTGKTVLTLTRPRRLSNNGKPLEYEIHEPKQDAYGDWTLIKVGDHYHLFGDYDSADHNKPRRMGRFHTDDLDKEFQWSGEIGKGFHPDLSVGFAEGKFYVIIQRATDFVSPGPWVDSVEARAESTGMATARSMRGPTGRRLRSPILKSPVSHASSSGSRQGGY